MSQLAVFDFTHTRDIVTPEGVPIPFEVATAGHRIIALIIDLVVIHAIVFVVWILAAVAGLVAGGVGLSLAIVTSFLVRNFYFVVMELSWGGQTIGKKYEHLRVISRDGGPLTSEAILARNLTRDMEIFLPLTALLAPQWLIPSSSGWALLLSTAWVLVVALLPLFNKDRLRAGDIIGGTLVVVMPRPVLLDDMAGVGSMHGSAPGREADAQLTFTALQLDYYGIKELQVLEDVLRHTEGGANPELAERVCEQIRSRIDWQGPAVEPRPFLLAFYRAQRGRLEQRMLFGERRESKRVDRS